MKKGSVITAITLVSRPLGFVREAVQAYLFGATVLVDAFVVAFNFPELIQTLFLTGATSAFLIPVCSRYLNEEEEFSKIYATFINLSIILLGVLSLIFFLFSSPILRVIAPGFKPETHRIARTLFVIMIPVIALHAILSVMKAFLNAREHFAAPELSGILWNLIFILFVLALGGKIGIYSLAVGVSAGSLAQVLMQIPYLRNHGIRYSFSLSLGHPSLREARNLFTGALVASSVVPINGFVDRLIGSYLPSGQLASLAYAFRFFILPFSLFAVPTYTVLFSKVSGLYHRKDWEAIRAHIDSGLVLLCVTLVPCSVFLCLAGDTMLSVIYQRGTFTARDTYLTYRALSGFSVGLVFYALSISFVRIFNAFHDVKTPALIGVGSIALNGILDFVLMGPLENMGIALSTSIVSACNFLALYLVFRKRSSYRMSRQAKREIVQSLLAGAAVAVLIVVLKRICGPRPLLSLASSVVAVVVVYGVVFRDYYLGYLRRRSV